jgi:hypothetical protein
MDCHAGTSLAPERDEGQAIHRRTWVRESDISILPPKLLRSDTAGKSDAITPLVESATSASQRDVVVPAVGEDHFGWCTEESSEELDETLRGALHCRDPDA